MNTYIFDWNGTLSTVTDPKGFVRALQMLGHKVVLWTGDSNLDHPVAAAVNRFVAKGDSLRTLALECMEEWPETETLYLSDDERHFAQRTVRRMASNPDLKLPMVFLDPDDLGAHLTSLALTTPKEIP